MARLSKQDWLAEGFKLLSEFAQDKLRIMYLCERLNVTRGSFYHHFTGIDNYVSELMQAWQQQNTLELIRGANKGKSAEERMEILSELVAQKDQKIETAIRSWSFYHPVVQQHLAKVDEVRLDFLRQLFEGIGFAPKTAKIKARLEYATLIGIQQLFPDISKSDVAELWEVQRKMTMLKQ